MLELHAPQARPRRIEGSERLGFLLGDVQVRECRPRIRDTVAVDVEVRGAQRHRQDLDDPAVRLREPKSLLPVVIPDRYVLTYREAEKILEVIRHRLGEIDARRAGLNGLVNAELDRIRVSARRGQRTGHRERPLGAHGELGRAHGHRARERYDRRTIRARNRNRGGRVGREDHRRLPRAIRVSLDRSACHLNGAGVDLYLRGLGVEGNQDDVVDGPVLLGAPHHGTLRRDVVRLLVHDRMAPAIQSDREGAVALRERVPVGLGGSAGLPEHAYFHAVDRRPVPGDDASTDDRDRRRIERRLNARLQGVRPLVDASRGFDELRGDRRYRAPRRPYGGRPTPGRTNPWCPGRHRRGSRGYGRRPRLRRTNPWCRRRRRRPSTGSPGRSCPRRRTSRGHRRRNHYRRRCLSGAGRRSSSPSGDCRRASCKGCYRRRACRRGSFPDRRITRRRCRGRHPSMRTPRGEACIRPGRCRSRSCTLGRVHLRPWPFFLPVGVRTSHTRQVRPSGGCRRGEASGGGMLGSRKTSERPGTLPLMSLATRM